MRYDGEIEGKLAAHRVESAPDKRRRWLTDSVEVAIVDWAPA